MVFCYKIITETPRRSGASSPRKVEPMGRVSNMPSSMSHLISSLDYEASDAMDSIPERDWRLLAALARKREENDEREKLADQFRKMWQKEKEERDQVDAEISEQYKRYIHKKREQERNRLEYKRFQRTLDHHARCGELLNSIRHKEQRSADLLAHRDDKKISELIDRALEEEARAHLAADRRVRLDAAEQMRRRVDLNDAEKRADEAQRRRNATLRDASRRAAISNALSSWESSVVLNEVRAAQSARVLALAARAALQDARREQIARARAARVARGRRLAAFTAHLREAIRNS
ncbi:luc7-like protein 3 [Achroia grisella]|uniref:luc7-like protein 3 n=1 Tax=Achroia grisella TaxID=688607 RepID=UPI0027D23285|nr:luc7-like protein 3 [Achroia grisella]